MSAITFLDHTADVGCRVTAPTPAELFHLAARAMLALLQGTEEEIGPAPEGADLEVRIDLEVDRGGWATLLRDWLGELLFLHEVRGRDYAASRFHRLDAAGLAASVATTPSAPAVREIKGVTHHELGVREGPDGWEATVIFDV